MALFLNKWGDIRGSVADLTFSANAGGAYIRSKVTPLNPQTAKQMAARARLAAFASEYSHTLTDNQREGWIDIAKRVPYTNIFGDKRYLNGIAMYCKVNCLLSLVGATTLTDAPNNLEVRPLLVEIVSIPTTGSLEYSVNITPTVSATETIAMYTTPALPPSINFVKNLYRYSHATPGPSPNPLSLEVDQSIGSFNIGNKMHSMVVRINHDTGGVTLGVPISATIIA